MTYSYTQISQYYLPSTLSASLSGWLEGIRTRVRRCFSGVLSNRLWAPTLAAKVSEMFSFANGPLAGHSSL